MFLLYTVSDCIRISAPNLIRDWSAIVSEEIDGKYANRVIPGVGIVICLADIIKMGEAQIVPGDGAGHVNVTFRLMVFRPIPGELLSGRVHANNTSAKNGVSVSLGFFHDTFIPPRLMANGMYWQSNSPTSNGNSDRDGHWVWDYDIDGDVTKLELLPSSPTLRNNSDVILFRVTSVLFNDKIPVSSVETETDKKLLPDNAQAPPTSGSESNGVQAFKGGPSHNLILDGRTLWAGGEEGDGIHTTKTRAELLIPRHVSLFPPAPLQMTPSLQYCMTRSHATLGIGLASNPARDSTTNRKHRLGHQRVEIDPQSQEAHLLDKKSRHALSVLVSNITSTSNFEDLKGDNLDATHTLNSVGLDQSLLNNRPMLVMGTIQEDGLGGWTWWGDALPPFGRHREKKMEEVPVLQPAPRAQPQPESQEQEAVPQNEVLLVVDAPAQSKYDLSSGQKRPRGGAGGRGRRGRKA